MYFYFADASARTSNAIHSTWHVRTGSTPYALVRLWEYIHYIRPNISTEPFYDKTSPLHCSWKNAVSQYQI